MNTNSSTGTRSPPCRQESYASKIIYKINLTKGKIK